MNNENQAVAVQQNEPVGTPKRKLVAKMAEKFGVDGNMFWDTLKSTAFKQRNGQAPTNEQMMALLVVADQYDLNPFLKEIYAFPDQSGGIVPVVGIDGWSRIINSHPNFDGMEFRVSDETVQLDGLENPVFEWIECIMYRNDRTRPTVIREYLDEIYKPPIRKNGSNGPYEISGPWQSHTKRFSRHKVIIQTARIALGYTGIYDQDEAENILDAQQITGNTQASKVVSINQNPANALPNAVSNEGNELLGELSNSFINNEEAVQVSAEQLAEETKSIPDKAKANTEFGKINAKDKAMIDQMVEYTIQTGAWKATYESFTERYRDETLEYAQSELAEAQVKAEAEK